MHKIRKNKPTAQSNGAKERASFAQFMGEKQRTKYTTQGENAYVFESFHDKINKIDVLLSHYTDQSQPVELTNDTPDSISTSTQSHFINRLQTAYAAQKKQPQNPYQSLYSYCHSYALLIFNKTKIIQTLASKMLPTEKISDLVETFELFIALAKDLKDDIYNEFLSDVLPKIIELLTIKNEEIIERIFSSLSLCIKYFTEKIGKSPLKMFKYYFELVMNSNNLYRTFACESFAYCIKKTDLFSAERLFSLILEPILHPDQYFNSEEMGTINEYERYTNLLQNAENNDANSTTMILKSLPLYLHSHYYKMARVMRHAYSCMIFECLRGIQGSIGCLDIVFSMLCCLSNYKENYYFLFTIIEVLNLKIVNYVDPQTLLLYIERMLLLLTEIIGHDSTDNEGSFNLIILLIKDIIGLKNGKLLATEKVKSIVHILTDNKVKAVYKHKFTWINTAELLSLLLSYRYQAFKQEPALFKSVMFFYYDYAYYLINPIIKGYTFLFNLYLEVEGKNYDIQKETTAVTPLEITKCIKPFIKALMHLYHTHAISNATHTNVLFLMAYCMEYVPAKYYLQEYVPIEISAQNNLQMCLLNSQLIYYLNEDKLANPAISSTCISILQNIIPLYKQQQLDDSPNNKYSLTECIKQISKESNLCRLILSYCLKNLIKLSKYNKVDKELELISSSYDLIKTDSFLYPLYVDLLRANRQQMNEISFPEASDSFEILSRYLYKADPACRQFAIKAISNIDSKPERVNIYKDIMQFICLNCVLDNLHTLKALLIKITDVYTSVINDDSSIRELVLYMACGNLWMRLTPLHEHCYKIISTISEIDQKLVQDFFNYEITYLVTYLINHAPSNKKESSLLQKDQIENTFLTSLYSSKDSKIDVVSIDQFAKYLVNGFKKCIEQHPTIELTIGELFAGHILKNYYKCNRPIQNLIELIINQNSFDYCPNNEEAIALIREVNSKMESEDYTHLQNITIDMLSLISLTKNINKIEKWEDMLQCLFIDKNEEISLNALKAYCLSNEVAGLYTNELIEFCQDATYKAALTNHYIDDVATWFRPEHRQVVLKIIILMLLPKIRKKKGKINKTSEVARRKAVSNYISTIDSNDMQLFWNCLLSPYKISINHTIGNRICYNSCKNLYGLMQSLKNIIEAFGIKIAPYSIQLSNLILTLITDLNNAISLCESAADLSYLSSQYKNLRVVCLKRMHQLIQNYMENSSDVMPINERLYSIFEKHFTDECIMKTQATSCLVQVVSLWCANAKNSSIIIAHPEICRSIAYMLENCQKEEIMMPILDNLIQLSKDNPKIVEQLRRLFSQLGTNTKRSKLLNRLCKLNIKDPFVLHYISIVQGLVAIINSNYSSILPLIIPIVENMKASEDVDEDAIISLLQIIEKIPYGIDSSLDLINNRIKFLFITNDNLKIRGYLLKLILRMCPDTSEMADGETTQSILNALCETKKRGVTIELKFDSLINTTNAIANNIDHYYKTVDMTMIMLPIFYYIGNNDYAIRSAAEYCIGNYMEYLGNNSLLESAIPFLKNTLIYRMQNLISTSQDLILKSAIKTLRQLVMICYKKSIQNEFAFTDLINICNIESEDGDDLLNSVNVDIQEKAKALKNITRSITSKPISSYTLMNIIVPYALAPILPHKKEQIIHANQQSEQTIIREFTMLLCKSIEKLSEWNNIKQILKQLLYALKLKETNQKTIMAVLSSAIMSINLSCKSSNQIINQKLLIKQVSQYKPNIETEEKRDPSISAFIKKQVICILEEHIKETKENEKEEENPIKFDVSCALIAAYDYLPIQEYYHGFNTVVLIIANTLKSRSYETRNRAVHCLQKILHNIPICFFHQIVNEIKFTLRLGYQRHVLAYCLHSLLKEIITLNVSIPTEMIENTIPLIKDIVNQELYGEVGEEKEVAAIRSKFKEAKKLYCYGTLNKLAMLISPQLTGLIINDFKKSLLEGGLPLADIRKTEEALTKIAAGLATNTSLTHHSLYDIVLELIKSLEIAPLNSSEIAVKSTHQSISKLKERNYLIKDEINTPIKAKIKNKEISLNAIHMFITSLSINMLLKDTEKQIVKSDKIAPLYHYCMNGFYSSHSPLVANCLIILRNIVVDNPLLLQANSEQLVVNLLEKMKNIGVEDVRLAQSLYSLLTQLISNEVIYHLTEGQLKIILECMLINLAHNEKQKYIFECISTIINKKVKSMSNLVKPIITQVCDTLFNSKSAALRESCKNLIYQYITTYPIEPRELQDRILFLLMNIGYELEESRRSAIELLQQLLETLDMSVLKGFTNNIVLTILLRLVNEESSYCKAECLKCLNILVAKLDSELQVSQMSIISSMLKSPINNKKGISMALCGCYLHRSMMAKYPDRAKQADLLLVYDCLLGSVLCDGDLNEGNVLINSTNSLSDLFWYNPSYIWSLAYLCLSNIEEYANSKYISELGQCNHLIIAISKLISHKHPCIRVLAQNILCRLIDLLGTDQINADYIINIITNISNNFAEGFLHKDISTSYCSTLQKLANKHQQLSSANESLVTFKITCKIAILSMKNVSICEPTVINVLKYIKSSCKSFPNLIQEDSLAHILMLCYKCLSITVFQSTKMPQEASKIMSFLKEKLGQEKLSTLYAKIQKFCIDKRNSRIQQKRNMAVANPEAYNKMLLKKRKKKKLKEE